MMSQHRIDASGLKCPEPVMLLHAALQTATVGDHIEIVATDPGSVRDIHKLCHYLPHELISEDMQDQRFRFVVCKR